MMSLGRVSVALRHACRKHTQNEKLFAKLGEAFVDCDYPQKHLKIEKHSS
jgi:hypothetical protein